MKIVRRAYEHIVREYELEITDEVIRDLNLAFDKRMNGKSHPTITKDMVYTVMLRIDNPEQYPELESEIPWGMYGTESLRDFIFDEVNQYVWESDADIVDRETEDFDDEICLDIDEKAQMK